MANKITFSWTSYKAGDNLKKQIFTELNSAISSLSTAIEYNVGSLPSYSETNQNEYEIFIDARTKLNTLHDQNKCRTYCPSKLSTEKTTPHYISNNPGRNVTVYTSPHFTNNNSYNSGTDSSDYGSSNDGSQKTLVDRSGHWSATDSATMGYESCGAAGA